MIPLTAKPVISKAVKTSTTTTRALSLQKPIAATPKLPAASALPVAAKPPPKVSSLSGAVPLSSATTTKPVNLVPRQVNQPPGGVSVPAVEQAVVTSSKKPIADVAISTRDGYVPQGIAESIAAAANPTADELEPKAAITETLLVAQFDRMPGFVGGGPSTGSALGIPPAGNFETLAEGGVQDANRLSFPGGSETFDESKGASKPFISDETKLIVPPPSTPSSMGLILVAAAVVVAVLVL